MHVHIAVIMMSYAYIATYIHTYIYYIYNWNFGTTYIKFEHQKLYLNLFAKQSNICLSPESAECLLQNKTIITIR